jgi:hypothetical protein
VGCALRPPVAASGGRHEVHTSRGSPPVSGGPALESGWAQPGSVAGGGTAASRATGGNCQTAAVDPVRASGPRPCGKFKADFSAGQFSGLHAFAPSAGQCARAQAGAVRSVPAGEAHSSTRHMCGRRRGGRAVVQAERLPIAARPRRGAGPPAGLPAAPTRGGLGAAGTGWAVECIVLNCPHKQKNIRLGPVIHLGPRRCEPGARARHWRSAIARHETRFRVPAATAHTRRRTRRTARPHARPRATCRQCRARCREHAAPSRRRPATAPDQLACGMAGQGRSDVAAMMPGPTGDCGTWRAPGAAPAAGPIRHRPRRWRWIGSRRVHAQQRTAVRNTGIRRRSVRPRCFQRPQPSQPPARRTPQHVVPRQAATGRTRRP